MLMNEANIGTMLRLISNLHDAHHQLAKKASMNPLDQTH